VPETVRVVMVRPQFEGRDEGVITALRYMRMPLMLAWSPVVYSWPPR
jgi:hypothetical protein